MNISQNYYYKIGHVIYDSPGGAGNIVFKLLENIKSNRFCQEAILFGNLLENSPYFRKYSKTVTFNMIFKHRGFDFNYLVSLLKLIKRKKYDLIFLHDSTASMYGRIVKIFYPRVKIISVYHAAGPDSRIKRLLNLITGVFLVSKIICVSEFVKSNLPKLLRKKAQVIYNGIDTEIYYENTTDKGCTPVITTVCRLEPPKDPLTLVKVCRELLNEGEDFNCVIAGDGIQYKEIKNFIDANNLNERIRLLGWHEDVSSLLAQSDIFVLSTFSEGLPISILEAMSVGLPAVVSRVGGNPELVHDGVNGYLFKAGDEADLAKCLHLLLTNSELRKTMGYQSLQLVKSFSFDNFVNQWTDYIHRVLNK